MTVKKTILLNETNCCVVILSGTSSFYQFGKTLKSCKGEAFKSIAYIEACYILESNIHPGEYHLLLSAKTTETSGVEDYVWLEFHHQNTQSGTLCMITAFYKNVVGVINSLERPAKKYSYFTAITFDQSAKAIFFHQALLLGKLLGVTPKALLSVFSGSLLTKSIYDEQENA